MPANVDAPEENNESHARIMKKKARWRYGRLRSHLQPANPPAEFDCCEIPQSPFGFCNKIEL
jgi:hypothetical protein